MNQNPNTTQQFVRVDPHTRVGQHKGVLSYTRIVVENSIRVGQHKGVLSYARIVVENTQL